MITVLIVDDHKETRNNVKTILSFDERIEVIGQASNGEEAIEMARKLSPKIILMDINMPVLDGLRAAEEISLTNPETSIIIMSVQGESEYLKNAMSAGAREYITKPFTSEDLISTIVRVFEAEEKKKLYQQQQENTFEDEQPCKVITVFSTKGGVGKSTVAVNLAVSLTKQSKKKIAILDLDLQFGDVAILLNIQPKKTIYNLIEEINSVNDEAIEDYMITHFSGLKVLCAPTKPEYAEYITASHIEKIIRLLKKYFSYIIIDTTQSLSDLVLTTLDQSDEILFLSTLDLPTIKNVNLGLEVLENLNYSKDKIKLVLNKASEQYGVKYKDIEDTLKMSISNYLPEDSATVTTYANKGFPFIFARSEKRISKAIQELGEDILNIKGAPEKRKVFNFLL